MDAKDDPSSDAETDKQETKKADEQLFLIRKTLSRLMHKFGEELDATSYQTCLFNVFPTYVLHMNLLNTLPIIPP